MKTKVLVPVLGVVFLAVLGGVAFTAKRGIDFYRGSQYEAAGRAAFDHKDWPEAIRNYSAAIQRLPRNASVRIGRGCAYEVQGEVDLALQDYTVAIRLAPQNAYAWANRGHAYVAKRQLAQAIQDENEAIRLAPQAAIGYEFRAYIFALRGENAQEIRDYDQVLRLQPHNARAYLARGAAYALQKNWGKAIDDYNQAVQFAPESTAAYVYRAVAHAARGESDDALSDYEDALRINPQDVLTLDNRGRFWVRQNEWEKGIADWRKGIELEATNAVPYNSLAWVLATSPKDNVRDGKEAVVLARKACELSAWKNWAFIDTLAAACAEAGDFEQALRYQTQAVEQAVRIPAAPAETRTEMRERVGLYREHKAYRETPK